MTYGRDLLKKVQGVEDQENPLEIIGLSSAILELELSEDELYQHCQRIAASLLARVHPDRLGGKEVPAARRFSDAVNLLRDRDRFAEALGEFRIAQNFGRAEERLLRVQVRNLSSNLKRAQGELQTKEAAYTGEVIFRRWMRRYFIGKGMSISPDGMAKHLASAQRIGAVSFGFSFCDPPVEGAKGKVNALHAPYKSKRQIPETALGPMRQVINENNLSATRIASLIRRAEESSFEFPALQWGFDQAVRELGFSKVASSSRKGGRDVVRSISIQGWDSSASRLYREVLKAFDSAFGNRYVARAAVVPERLTIEHEFLRDSLDGMTFCILGTVDMETALLYLKRAMPGTLAVSGRLIVKEDILLWVEPFIAPGRAIISLQVPLHPVAFRATDSSEAQWKWLMRKRDEVSPLETGKEKIDAAPYLFLSHIVLDTNPAN